MNASLTAYSNKWLVGTGAAAIVFGIMTLVSGTSILFLSQKASEMAGDFVPFVLWFNFVAGFCLLWSTYLARWII